MQRYAAIILLCVLSLGLSVSRAGAQDQNGISPKCHPWGLFKPGAWKTVRIISETLDDQGVTVSKSTTESKMTLIAVDRDGITLETRSCMEVAGKRFEPEPQVVKQGFHGEALCPGLKWNPSVDGEIAVEGRKIPCRIQRLECVVPNGKNVTTLYFSLDVAPFLLKRESVTSDPEGKITLSENVVDTVAIDVPLLVRGEKRNGVRMKTVYKNESGSVTTWTDMLPEVPGGVVANNVKELDQTGRLIRRSALELVDYDTEPERTGPLGRKRPARHRAKTPPRYEP